MELDRAFGLKRRDLRESMHARVSTSRPLGQYVFARQTSNRCGQRALDGRASRLHLPARELGPIIGKDQFEIARNLFRVLECGCFILRVYKV